VGGGEEREKKEGKKERKKKGGEREREFMYLFTKY